MARSLITLILWITLLPPSWCCPFYTLAPARVNYTTIEPGLTAAATAAVPLHVCDKATISKNELPATIELALPVTVIGDVDSETGSAAYLTIEEDVITPIFHVAADAVVFETLQITFFDTLFKVGSGSTPVALQFYRTKCLFGNICVHIDAASASAFDADHGYFYGNDNGILYDGSSPSQVATVTCPDCRFINQRIAAILSRGSAGLAAFDMMTFEDTVMVNVLVPFGTQTTTAANVIIAAVSAEYKHQMDFVNCQTYSLADDEFDTFAAGAASASTKTHLGTSDRVILFSLIALLSVTIIAVTITCVYRQGKRAGGDPVTAKKSWLSTSALF